MGPGIEPGISESTVGDDILLATAAPKELMFLNSLNLVPMGKESNGKRTVPSPSLLFNVSLKLVIFTMSKDRRISKMSDQIGNLLNKISRLKLTRFNFSLQFL